MAYFHSIMGAPIIPGLLSTHGELTMEDTGCSDGKFSFRAMFVYLKEGHYPDTSDKADKRSLREQVSYFIVNNTSLHYIGSAGKCISNYLSSYVSLIKITVLSRQGKSKSSY